MAAGFNVEELLVTSITNRSGQFLDINLSFRVTISAWKCPMVEWFVEVIKVYRSFAYPSTVRHWTADTIGPKVCRFNFYSRQCNIHYTATSSTWFPLVVGKMLSASTRLIRLAPLPFVFFLPISGSTKVIRRK